MLVVTLGLVSCGGGNDVASSGASAVSDAAPVTTNDASTTALTPTEPKINGQVDERTGVAPVAAQATIWTPQSNGGCGRSATWGWTGPPLTYVQSEACLTAIININWGKNSDEQCRAFGGAISCMNRSGTSPCCIVYAF